MTDPQPPTDPPPPAGSNDITPFLKGFGLCMFLASIALAGLCIVRVLPALIAAGPNASKSVVVLVGVLAISPAAIALFLWRPKPIQAALVWVADKWPWASFKKTPPGGTP